MAIYQFHIRDQHGLILDEDGVELPNALAAVREALRGASEFFADASAPTDMMFEIVVREDPRSLCGRRSFCLLQEFMFARIRVLRTLFLAI